MRENVGSCIGVSAGASRGAGARAAKLYFPEFLKLNEIEWNSITSMESLPNFPQLFDNVSVHCLYLDIHHLHLCSGLH